MADSTPKEKILAILSGQRIGEKVCSSPLTTPTVEQMELSGGFWPEAFGDAERMARLAGAAPDHVGFEGVKIPFDLTVEAEALGCQIKPGSRDTQPSVKEAAFGDMANSSFPSDFLMRGRIPAVLEACSLLRERYGHYLPVYAQVVGPFTLAGHAFGSELLLRGTKRNRPLVKELLVAVADLSLGYASALLERGADAICVADPLASGDLLSPVDFKDLLVPALRRFREGLRGKAILHICGNTSRMIPAMPETGFEAFSFEGPVVDAKYVKETLGDRMVLVGNVPTFGTLLKGTPEDVIRDSLYALESGVDILAPACGLPPHTPLANLRAMVEATRIFNEWNARS